MASRANNGNASSARPDPEAQPFLGRRPADDDEDDEINAVQKAGRFDVNDLKKPLVFFGSLFTVIVLALFFDKLFVGRFFKGPQPDIRALSADVFEAGLRQCARIQETKSNPSAYLTGGPPANLATRRNPRYFAMLNNTESTTKGNPILIKDAIVLDGDGGRFEHVDVALAHGLVIKIGKDITKSDVVKSAQSFAAQWTEGLKYEEGDVVIINANGRYVTPGLVDQHSHVGAYSFPQMFGNADGNEMSSQTNPQLRVQDGINILDSAIDIIASGGVTTSLVLPGSGTLMGGEAVAIKLLKPTSFEVEDMTVQRNMHGKDGKKWRWMKMACGENPKRSDGTPTSRMGSGWLYRKRFEEARTTLRSQDDWCTAAIAAQAKFSGDAHLFITERFPDPIEQDSLIGLLRGDVRVNIHCYEPHDIEMMVRNKHEFGFEISSFHHAVEAHLVAPLLARENISVALFADHSLYKKEGYNATVKAGQIFRDAGVKVSYKSDHPVLNAQHLIYEAQKSAQYGLDADTAFAAVTSVPAERLGMGWRIGKLAVGYDADVLVWDRHPLDLGAHPLKVIIDGYLLPAGDKELTPIPAAPTPATPPMSVVSTSDASPLAYTITNVSKIFADDGDVKKGSVVVERGVVTCVGVKCVSKGTVYDMNGGVLIPGLIASNLNLGLVEIPPESLTNNGVSSSTEAIAGDVRAVDGIHVGGDSRALREAFYGGVLTSISVPDTDGFVRGLSAAFRTGAELYSEAILKAVVALHVDMGLFGLGPKTPSVSSQVATLRKLITTSTSGPFHEAFTGKIPLVVGVHDPNDISKILAIKREMAPDLRLIISGASGSWVVAKELAELNIPVLLTPPRCVPMFWETRWCRVPSTHPSTADLLVGAGVKILLSQPESGIRGNLLWEAGWILADTVDGVVTENDAIGSVTWNVAKAFGVEGAGTIAEGRRASFVGLNGGPLGFGKKIQIIGDGVDVVVKPEQL
ncbi:hypothetical protein HDU67_007940 [Dinochytrium kinnereticum]|nr:hypothetical protein HDU67_007940 [Dinochytrium kinnereticum]